MIDTRAPALTANVTGISDGISGPLADGASTSDRRPSVSGTLSAALGAGDSVRVLRDGATRASAIVSGTTWTFQEPPPGLTDGSYRYSAQVIDSAGNAGAIGQSRAVTVNTTVPLPGVGVAITTVNGVAFGGAASVPVNNDSTPTLAGTIERALSGNEVVRVYQNSEAVGTASASGTSWTFTSVAVPDGTHSFNARVELSATVFGATLNKVSIPIDTAPPTQKVTLTATSNEKPFLAVTGFLPTSPGQPPNPVPATKPPGPNIANGAITNDTRPTIQVVLSPGLASGERLEITRNTPSTVANFFPRTFTAAGNNCGANCFSFEDTSNNVSIALPATGNSNGAPGIVAPNGTSVTYSARVIDVANNPGTPTTLTFSFGYFECDQGRALARVNTIRHAHVLWPDNVDVCAACHTGGVSGRFVAVPPPTSKEPRYWCTVPQNP